MLILTRCYNAKCDTVDSDGHHEVCPTCGTQDIEKWNSPENADDIKTMRADYNRRHMHEPGFVPSVEYDKNGNPVES